MAQNKNNTLIQKAGSNTKMQVKKVYWVHCFNCNIAKFVPAGSIGNFISSTNHTWRRTTYQQCL